MKKMVCSTLPIFPDEIIDFVSKHCWFIGSFEDGWSFAIRGKEIKKNEYLIFLSDELLKEDRWQIRYTIAHEVGHVVLGHRNSIKKIQTKREVDLQEKEAHSFAQSYLATQKE